MSSVEVWRWDTVQPDGKGPLVDTDEWWRRELDRRTKDGWRLVEQRPSGYAGCTVYVFTRGCRND